MITLKNSLNADVFFFCISTDVDQDSIIWILLIQMVVRNVFVTVMLPHVNQHRIITTIQFVHPFLIVRVFFISYERHEFPLGVDGWRAINQSGHEAPVYSDTGSYIYVQSLPGQDLTFEAPRKDLTRIIHF